MVSLAACNTGLMHHTAQLKRQALRILAAEVHGLWRCRLQGDVLVGNAHRRTAAVMSACRRLSLSNTAKVCASAGGRASRRRRNSAYSRAAAGTNWLSSTQAAGVLML